MFDRSRTRFNDKNWQKSGVRFFIAQFRRFLIRVKTVALWSAKKKKNKNKKDHKGLRFRS